MQTYLVSIGRLRSRPIWKTPIDAIKPQAVAELTAAKLKKQTIRKTVSVLAMVLDHEHVRPNPVVRRSVV